MASILTCVAVQGMCVALTGSHGGWICSRDKVLHAPYLGKLRPPLMSLGTGLTAITWEVNHFVVIHKVTTSTGHVITIGMGTGTVYRYKTVFSYWTGPEKNRPEKINRLFDQAFTRFCACRWKKRTRAKQIIVYSHYYQVLQVQLALYDFKMPVWV